MRVLSIIISIHALRVEGDRSPRWRAAGASDFYPRPPGGGRRWQRRPAGSGSRISIHALRVEGDPRSGRPRPRRRCISIHALRVEGDLAEYYHSGRETDFYPRPPGGGRPLPCVLRPSPALAISIHALRVEGDRWCPRRCTRSRYISIHALRVEGDFRDLAVLLQFDISIHALRVEGDLSSGYMFDESMRFLSTPSGWRATAKTDKVFICFCAKGRRICLFKTREEKICRWRFKKDKFWVLIWCEGSGKSVCASASHCG